MKKRRLNKTRILAALMSLCMIISLFNGIDSLFQNETIAQAEDGGAMPDPDEYKDETLEHMWDSDGDGNPTNNDYWKAARSYYACTYVDGKDENTRNAKFAQFGGVYKRTIFHVYAFEGETICLGSSVYNSGIDVDNKLSEKLTVVSGSGGYSSTTHFPDEGSVDIIMTDLKGNKIPIDIRNSDGDTTGYIASPKAEFAAIKMTMNKDGTFNAEYGGAKYTPYTYKVKETGLYTFEFHSYDGTGAANPNMADERAIGSQWPTADNNYIDDHDNARDSNGNLVYNDAGGLIAALNITVFDENCQKQTGRTYADFLSLQMSTVSSSNKNVTESYYILTTDSYIYRMTFNDAAPYTYNFFSNNRGIFDNATGEIVYKSVKDVSNTNSFQKMGSFFVYPGNKETEKDKSFYIFLEYPDVDLEGELYEKAIQPDPATNIRFVGRVEITDGGGVREVPGAYTGVGGYFAFDVKEATTATLRLEFDHGRLKDQNFAPVEISGVVKPNSTNYFYWNGCDGNGKPVPPDTYNLNDIVYTVTAKAGEIHFPIFDMEYASGGITFTRLSHIYDKSGKQLDTPGSIYDLTKNVIYYDETAIYYGENVAVTGISESKVTGHPDKATTWAIDKFFANHEKGDYWQYRNFNADTYTSGIYNGQYKGGEYAARQSAYIKGRESTIRVGDHSHTTNIIDYFDTNGKVLGTAGAEPITDAQKKMIEYLDSSIYPVGKSDGTTNEYELTESPYNKPASGRMSTTDFAIANYWSFIPAKPATAKNNDELLYIVDPPKDEELFKLSGRVFYDVGAGGIQGNGVYDDSGANGEHLMSGVTLNLYKKTSDTATVSGKKYYNYNADSGKMDLVTAITPGVTYEFVDIGVTRTDGSYVFTNLTYDKTNGTEYLYEVVRPDSSYTLTSESQIARLISTSNIYGYYASHSFKTDYKGTEIQKIKVGGGGVDPTHLTYKANTSDTENAPNVDSSVCAVDVGYWYPLLDRSLVLKKDWNTSGTHPDTVIYEISYLDQSSGTNVYEYRTLSAGGSWTSKNQFLPTEINGSDVADYFVSAEYFIDNDYIYKYTFAYDKTKGKYSRFLGSASKISLDTVFSGAGLAKPDGECSVSDLPDQNGDGVSDEADLGEITGWEKISTEGADEYRAVIDRNILSDSNEITVTNSEAHGTIEIYKFHDEDDAAKQNALQGATFRLYKGDMATTMENISKNNVDWISEHYIGSATSRSNGHLTFTGLDPTQTYTVREVFAPDGYRILQEYYEVIPSNKTIAEGTEYVYNFDSKGYASFAIGNAPADTSLKIRKRIVGRAWQGGGTTGVTEDSFTFNIVTNAPKEVADLTDGTHDIQVTAEEQGILGSVSADVLAELSTFAANFNGTAASGNVTISYDDDYYNYTVDGKIYASADTKMSKDLLTDSKSDSTSAPKFQGVQFPMAGEYTFTITEENPTSDDMLNLEHSTYTYKVTVSVVRKYDDPNDEEDDTPMTTGNTHLEAEVSNITYREDDDSAFKTFSGSSPLFTNTYKTAPAEQSTSYNITKLFTGRELNEWLTGDNADKFTVEIKCEGAVTIDAVKNGNLVISGFDTGKPANLIKLTDDTGWEYTFTRADEKLEFKSFKFKDIEFPVQYVYPDGNVWTPANPEQTIPTNQEIIDNGLTPETLPVTYKFTIKEKLPEGAEDNVINGITYDESVYTLTIVLNNTEQGTISSGEAGKEEEDGIIEEIDITLSKGDDKSECKTRQGVLDQVTWLTASESDYEKDKDGLIGSVKFYYVDSKGMLQERESTTTAPTDAKLYFWKWEHHDAPGTAFGTDGHTMTITNTYSAQAVWTPQVEKILTGRTWRKNDVFTFTLTPDATNPDGCSLNDASAAATVTIDSTNKGADDKYINSFAPITFTKPVTYTFTLAERLTAGGITQPEPITITVTATDNNDGTLSLVFEFTDAEGNKLDEFKDYTVADPIKRTNIYNDTSEEFALEIEKKIIGRNWKDDDSFTFTIMPDAAAKTAIEGGFLTMPDTATALTKDEDTGNYTATISGTEGATATDVITKVLGNIIINGLPADEDMATYTFTISEDTTNLAEKNMLCRHDTVTLTVEVARVMVGDIPTGELNVSATYKYGDGTEVTKLFNTADTDPSPTTPLTATIPFENISLGTLTVEKEVVSSNDDETEFSFTATFKLDADKLPADITEKERTVKVTVDGEEKTLVLNKDTEVTYTFSLKHGDSITFSNILPNTTYTITEGTEPANYMFLRIMDKNGNNVYNESDGQKVTEQINVEEPPDKYTFISGKIHNLPSAGGTGTQLILLGALALIIAAALFYTIFHKNDKRREAR